MMPSLYYTNPPVSDGNAETGAGEWERLSDLEGSPNQVAESGGYTAGRQVTIGEDDAAFYTSSCGTWRSSG